MCRLPDFNNDGYADFAVLNTSFLTNLASDQNIMIFLGKGDGSFVRSTVSNVAANWISVGDFNNDGRIDIVASGASSLIILLGNGDGTFNASTMPIGANANESIVADFNRDGNLDLAVFNDTGLSVLLGNGNGTFTAKSTVAFPAGSYASAGVAGDFNGDGLLDIFTQAYVSSGNSVAYLLLGANNGTFVTTAVPFSSANVTALYQQVGDFNGDGKLDVVVNDSQSGSPALRVLFGNNDGTFSVSGATVLPSNASLSGGYIQNIAVFDIG